MRANSPRYQFSVSVVNYGIIFPSVPYYQSLEGVGGVGGSPDPAFLHPIPFFITFSLLCTPVPPWVWGLGRHMTFQTRVLSFISKVHSLKQD